MTKKEYINEILKSFDSAAEETPSSSALGQTVKKVSFTKGQLSMLLSMILNDKHITWNN